MSNRPASFGPSIAVELPPKELERRRKINIRLLENPADFLVKYIQDGRYDNVTLLETKQKYLGDFAFLYLLTHLRGVPEVSLSDKLKVLSALFTSSRLFVKPLPLLRFLFHSARDGDSFALFDPDVDVNDGDEYTRTAAELRDDGKLFVRSILHLVALSMIKPNTWYKLSRLILSGYVDDDLEDLDIEYNDDMPEIETVRQSERYHRRAAYVTMLLQYAPYTLSSGEKETLQKESDDLVVKMHRNYMGQVYPPPAKFEDQVAFARFVDVLLVEPAERQLAESTIDNALFRIANHKCKYEALNAVLTVIMTSADTLPLYVLQYIVLMAVPCIGEEYSNGTKVYTEYEVNKVIARALAIKDKNFNDEVNKRQRINDDSDD